MGPSSYISMSNIGSLVSPANHQVLLHATIYALVLPWWGPFSSDPVGTSASGSPSTPGHRGSQSPWCFARGAAVLAKEFSASLEIWNVWLVQHMSINKNDTYHQRWNKSRCISLAWSMLGDNHRTSSFGYRVRTLAGYQVKTAVH